MPVITSIKPQKNKKRVNIFLDQKFGFGIDLENFVKLGLRVEQELTEDKIEEVVKKSEFQKVLDKLLRFSALRPRSRKEYDYWLKKYKVHVSMHDLLFDRLRRLDFLDDKKFALWWVEQRLAFRPKSRIVIKYELKNKGIDKKIIDEVLSEVAVDDEVAARRLIVRNGYKWTNLSRLDRKKKVTNFLTRHGFRWEVIKKILVTDFN